MGSFQVVISRFDESVNWADQIPNVVIYNKGPELELFFGAAIPLPNIGREPHTYLTHIVRNYENLADVTLFLLGSMEKHLAKNVVCLPLELYNYVANNPDFPILVRRWFRDPDYPGRIQFWGHWKEALDRGDLLPEPLSLGEWIEDYLQVDLPQHLLYCPCACFSVHRDFIWAKPKRYYARLLDRIPEHPNPEQAHYYERTWNYLFGGKS